MDCALCQMTTSFIGLSKSSEYLSAIYSVDIASGQVYMRVALSVGDMDSSSVVIADADRFSAAWADKEAKGGPASWVRDYKLPNAARGFSLGQSNPVPLAQIGSCGEVIDGRRPHWRGLFKRPQVIPLYELTMVNGITRTMWLLVNGARSFPIKCPNHCVDLTHKAIGTRGTSPIPLTELARHTQKAWPRSS